MNITRIIETKVRVDAGFTTRWLDEFIALKCAPELIPYFPNSKEITESMAVFGAVRKCGKWPGILADSEVTCVVPGDGVSPRTGVIAAYRSRWDVHSVDPMLRERTNLPKRLTLHRCKVQDFCISCHKTAVILSTHSHALLDDTIRACHGWNKMIVIALQCCVPMTVGNQVPYREWRDGGVFSPENRIKLWKLKGCNHETAQV